jgi:5'(3')-deoxyribonucleotidase
MKISELLNEDGRIVKGVNTTVDVDTDEIKTQAAKFGNTVDKDGRPPQLSKKVKGKSTNVLFNLGMTESEAPRYTAAEWAIIEGGHTLEEPQPPVKQKTARELFSFISKDGLSEALGEISANTEIFVDMDGVLADFFGEWAKVMGKDSFRDIEDPAAAISKIKDVEDFWLNLPVLPQARQLLMLIKRVKGKYKICTSPLADDPRSEPHKREWVKKNLAFFLPEEVIVTHNKPQFATAKDGTPNILIDDYGVNIRNWEEAGGIGFKYKDHKFERTAKDIKQHMDAPVEENFADGKKKGKSRPGRVKKSGASCNGSVTALRKRAKKASGEKAKMLHWCANMKSGRKKK